MTSSCPVGACLLLPGRAELNQGKWSYRFLCRSDLPAWSPFCVRSREKGEHPGLVSFAHTTHPTHIDISLDSNSLWATHLRGQASSFQRPLFSVLSCPSCPHLESGTLAVLASVTVLPSGNHPCALALALETPPHQPSARLLVSDFSLFSQLSHVMISRHGCHI